jgi:phenylglyoxylate dehydrogenase epsilon subunit
VLGSSIEVAEGIVVDESMRTSAPDVWAAGDVAEPEIKGVRRTNLIHPNAVLTGRVAGASMAGVERQMPAHIADTNVMTLFGRRFFSAGSMGSGAVLSRAHPNGDLLKVFLTGEDAVCGVQMVGNVTRGGLYQSMIGRKVPKGYAERLLSPSFNFGEISSWPMAG